MKHALIRFYIGLVTRGGQPVSTTAREAALNYLALTYPAGITVLEARGVWQGSAEPSMVVEAIVPADSAAYRWDAAYIAGILDQSCVGTAVLPVEWSLTDRDGGAA